MYMQGSPGARRRGSLGKGFISEKGWGGMGVDMREERCWLYNR